MRGYEQWQDDRGTPLSIIMPGSGHFRAPGLAQLSFGGYLKSKATVLDTPPPCRASPPVLYHSNTKAKFLTLVGAGSSHKGRTILSSDWRSVRLSVPQSLGSERKGATARFCVGAYATLLDVHGSLARGDKKGPPKRTCESEILGPG